LGYTGLEDENNKKYENSQTTIKKNFIKMSFEFKKIDFSISMSKI